MSKDLQELPTIVVEVVGGLVQSISCDQDLEAKVVVIDYDRRDDSREEIAEWLRENRDVLKIVSRDWGRPDYRYGVKDRFCFYLMGY